MLLEFSVNKATTLLLGPIFGENLLRGRYILSMRNRYFRSELGHAQLIELFSFVVPPHQLLGDARIISTRLQTPPSTYLIFRHQAVGKGQRRLGYGLNSGNSRIHPIRNSDYVTRNSSSHVTALRTREIFNFQWRHWTRAGGQAGADIAVSLSRSSPYRSTSGDCYNRFIFRKGE